MIMLMFFSQHKSAHAMGVQRNNRYLPPGSELSLLIIPSSVLFLGHHLVNFFLLEHSQKWATLPCSIKSVRLTFTFSSRHFISPGFLTQKKVFFTPLT